MCTRVFCCENSTAKVAGRTLDASFLDVPHLWWLPAGQVRKAHPDRDWTWTSKYASLTIAEWQDAAVDGMNDHGLGAHALMYTSAVYEPPDDRPMLSTLRWVNFALYLFGTVAEAVEGLAGMRVTPSLLEGLHLRPRRTALQHHDMAPSKIALVPRCFPSQARPSHTPCPRRELRARPLEFCFDPRQIVLNSAPAPRDLDGAPARPAHALGLETSSAIAAHVRAARS